MQGVSARECRLSFHWWVRPGENVESQVTKAYVTQVTMQAWFKSLYGVKMKSKFRQQYSLKKTPQKYTQVWKSLPGVFCCVFNALQCFQTQFWAVYLLAAGPRVSLYYVNGKVGNYKSNLKKIWPAFGESTSKTSLKFAWNLSTRLPVSPYGKKDDVRSFLGNWFSAK